MKIILSIILITYLFSNSITVYNSNFAQVNETQKISLKEGRQSVKFSNLPNSLIVNSVSPIFKSSGVHLISQSYKNNPLDITKLVEANLNKEVEFYNIDKKVLKGKLVNVSPTIIKSNGHFYIVAANSIIYSSLPLNVDNKPYLIWELNSKKAENTEVNLRYLISGISWSGNYTLTLKEKTLDLKAWASIVNKSGKSFKDVNVSLIAGRVDRNNFSHPVLYKTRRVNAMPEIEEVEPAIAEEPDAVNSESIGGYHLYKLPHSVNLLNNQSTQTVLLDAKNIKYYRYAAAENSDFTNYGERKLSFAQVIEFKNSKENNLGEPLPEGLVRVYKENHYVGNYYIKNRPVNEKVSLKIGKYFDITGTKTITKFIVKKKYRDIETKYNIKNRGDKIINIRLNENIPQNNDDTKFNTDCSDICSFKKINAFTREFDIILKPHSEYTFKTGFEIYY